ncbi:MAG TPA: T9SS type A sorting domain-containing protein, partial [Chitinophagales bacterium]|nr:T9SS type A sorting domain-containing protein [Chitinophagales bacterium]
PILTNTATTNIVPTFIQDVSRDGKVNVYPVPVSDVLYVNAPQAKSTGLTCRVVNAYGQVLSTRSLHAYPAGVDVSMLIPGVYLLVIDDADGYFGTVRFIKQ